MADFASQLQAVEVARAVMAALFDAANCDDTDRAAEIRGAREAELAALEAPEVPGEGVLDTPSRRALISAGLAG
jgi:hypothetical protein